MTVTSLYDLQNNQKEFERVRDTLINDVMKIAEAQYSNNQIFDNFKVKIKLQKINPYV